MPAYWGRFFWLFAKFQNRPRIALGIQHSLKSHDGNAVLIVGEARPARWRLKEATD